jgi:hypothetical protein
MVCSHERIFSLIVTAFVVSFLKTSFLLSEEYILTMDRSHARTTPTQICQCTT